MKFDSHVKLTNAALRKLKRRFPQASVTQAPLFRTPPGSYLKSAQHSTPVNNIGMAFQKALLWSVEELNSFLCWGLSPSTASLADDVALVDIRERWTHDSAEGQKYHFMRASNQSHHQAYVAACGFIHFHTHQWVSQVRTMLSLIGEPLLHASPQEMHRYQLELALALHALHDSFSTAHTVRGSVPVRGGAAPIMELLDYSAQDHSKHGDEDYTSGGLAAGTGCHSVDASVDLIAMGIKSIAVREGLVGWDRFVATWLPEKIDRETDTVVAQNAGGSRDGGGTHGRSGTAGNGAGGAGGGR